MRARGVRRFRVEFVRESFGGRVMISFAFVTPQYKALEGIEQVPRLSDVMPFLKRALYRAVELGQPFSNGLYYPGDPEGPPEEICNCRCTTLEWVAESLDEESD